MRKLLHKLFGIKFVVLIHFDGEINIRMAHVVSVKKYTRIYCWWCLGKVFLHPDGTTSRVYIDKWEYLFEENK